jgi:hypothetical protein
VLGFDNSFNKRENSRKKKNKFVEDLKSKRGIQ